MRVLGARGELGDPGEPGELAGCEAPAGCGERPASEGPCGSGVKDDWVTAPRYLMAWSGDPVSCYLDGARAVPTAR